MNSACYGTIKFPSLPIFGYFRHSELWFMSIWCTHACMCEVRTVSLLNPKGITDPRFFSLQVEYNDLWTQAATKGFSTSRTSGSIWRILCKTQTFSLFIIWKWGWESWTIRTLIGCGTMFTESSFFWLGVWSSPPAPLRQGQDPFHLDETPSVSPTQDVWIQPQHFPSWVSGTSPVEEATVLGGLQEVMSMWKAASIQVCLFPPRHFSPNIPPSCFLLASGPQGGQLMPGSC